MCFGTCCSFHSLSTLSPQIFTHSLTHSLTHRNTRANFQSSRAYCLCFLPICLPKGWVCFQMVLTRLSTHKTLLAWEARPTSTSPTSLPLSLLSFPWTPQMPAHYCSLLSWCGHVSCFFLHQSVWLGVNQWGTWAQPRITTLQRRLMDEEEGGWEGRRRRHLGRGGLYS
jgi:hypothetical protein